MGAHTFHQRAELSSRIFCDGGDVSELPVHYSSPPERLHVASVMEKLKFESKYFFFRRWDLSSPTRDGTHTWCRGSEDS